MHSILLACLIGLAVFALGFIIYYTVRKSVEKDEDEPCWTWDYYDTIAIIVAFIVGGLVSVIIMTSGSKGGSRYLMTPSSNYQNPLLSSNIMSERMEPTYSRESLGQVPSVPAATAVPAAPAAPVAPAASLASPQWPE